MLKDSELDRLWVDPNQLGGDYKVDNTIDSSDATKMDNSEVRHGLMGGTWVEWVTNGVSFFCRRPLKISPFSWVAQHFCRARWPVSIEWV